MSLYMMLFMVLMYDYISVVVKLKICIFEVSFISVIIFKVCIMEVIIFEVGIV